MSSGILLDMNLSDPRKKVLFEAPYYPTRMYHYPCVSLSVCLSIPMCLYPCVSIHVSLFEYSCIPISVSLSVCVSIRVCLSVYLSLSVCLSLHVSLSIRLSLSVCLSIRVFLSTGVSAAVFPFEIDRNTGHISLNKSLSVSQPNYNLTIAVTDDGSCCSSQRGARHTTLGYVVIRFIGVNHSPRFSNCPTTSNDVMVKEEMRNETSVFNVSPFSPPSPSLTLHQPPSPSITLHHPPSPSITLPQ